MKLLVFAFRHTNVEYIARKIHVNADITYLESSIEAIDDFLNTADFSKYTHILGMGMYSGRDQDKIRIETIGCLFFSFLIKRK